MTDISIQNTKIESDNLYVIGTVDGVQVKAHGWVARLNQLPTQQRKTAYLHQLLQNASALPAADQIAIKKQFQISFHKRLWHWLVIRLEYILIASGVYVILQHLPQIEHFLRLHLPISKTQRLRSMQSVPRLFLKAATSFRTLMSSQLVV